MKGNDDFELINHLGLVTREVSQTERDGDLARVVTASREYETTIDDTWDALTNPERIPRWFLPIEGDLKLGGHYQLKGNAGGEITECEPPRKLGLTWGMGGDTSWVRIELTAVAEDRTRLDLEHVAHVPEEFWDQFGPGGVGVGWDLAMLGLAEHLRTGAPVDPEMGTAWPSTPEGREYIEKASADWTEAWVRSGTSRDAAAAANERVIQFYTGGP